MHFYAEFIEIKRTNVRYYAFVRRELRLHSNAKLRLRLVVIFSLVREELKAV